LSDWISTVARIGAFYEQLSEGRIAVQELKDIMPVVERVEGDPMQLCMPALPSPLNARALPPLIINERGETLDEHVARTQPNFVTALSIMIQLAQVIERVHSVGWVHRDLKPSNCLLLAQPARWALIDWACAAKSGALPSLAQCQSPQADFLLCDK
jgi:tRNA A-37 threonylcarbamoyl transferase component Bud32